jgi:hypothetical protein
MKMMMLLEIKKAFSPGKFYIADTLTGWNLYGWITFDSETHAVDALKRIGHDGYKLYDPENDGVFDYPYADYPQTGLLSVDRESAFQATGDQNHPSAKVEDKHVNEGEILNG